MKSSPDTLPAASTAPVDAVDEAGRPCYFANGDLAEGYHTCDVGSPVSSCCPSGYACSGSTLCVLTATSSLEKPDTAQETISRGACTEPRWNGDSCRGGNCLDSEPATGGHDCDPVGDSGREEDCCAGGNAAGGCICSSNVAGVTLGKAEEAQTVLGRRAAPFSRIAEYPAGGKDVRRHQDSTTVSEVIVSTEAVPPEMLPGSHSTWVRISSSTVSVPAITPVAAPEWSGGWSGTSMSSTETPSESAITSQLDTTTSPSASLTERPITTTISIIASSLTHSSSSSSSSRTSIEPSVPTVIPVFPESSDTSSGAATTSLATKLGLGLGIPSVVLAVGLITAWVYRRQKRLRYAQPPPFDFTAPEMAPVSAADFMASAIPANYGDHYPTHGSSGVYQHQHPQQQQQQRRERAFHTWSEWGTGSGPWTETRDTAWGSGGGAPSSLDDNQIGFVDRSVGDQGYYYNGYHDVPTPASVPAPSPAPRYEDLGSPYEDRGYAPYRPVPVVHVHQPPQWAPPPGPMQGRRAEADREQGQGQGQEQGRGLEEPPPQRDLARVSRGLSVNEEVSPLSSTGSGMPYPRMSAISGMGQWDINPRVSRG